MNTKIKKQANWYIFLFIVSGGCLVLIKWWFKPDIEVWNSTTSIRNMLFTGWAMWLCLQIRRSPSQVNSGETI